MAGCHKDCNCYCGIDTAANRIKFLIAGLFITLFGISIVLFFTVLGDCLRDGEVYGLDSEEKCLEGKAQTVLLIRLLFYASLVGFVVPLSMLCCCTKNPHKDAEQGTQMVPQGEAVQAPAGARPAQAQSLEARTGKSTGKTNGGKIKAGYFQQRWEGYNALLDTPEEQ